MGERNWVSAAVDGPKVLKWRFVLEFGLMGWDEMTAAIYEGRSSQGDVQGGGLK